MSKVCTTDKYHYITRYNFFCPQVEIVEAYCDPRDSKAYLEPGDEASGKLYTSPDKDYSQPYTTGKSKKTTTCFYYVINISHSYTVYMVPTC